MKNHNAAKLNLLRKLLLTGTGLAAVAIPLGLGVLNAVPRRASSQNVPRPVLDAASIKRSAPGVSGGGSRIGTGGGFTATNLNLKHLIQIAYDTVFRSSLADQSVKWRLD